MAGFKGDYHMQNASEIHQQIKSSGYSLIKKIYTPFIDPFSIYWAIDYTHFQNSPAP